MYRTLIVAVTLLGLVLGGQYVVTQFRVTMTQYQRSTP